jgi:hypothetical protein
MTVLMVSLAYPARSTVGWRLAAPTPTVQGQRAGVDA